VRGLVLAAGPGRRLLPLTESRPKTLLELGNGRTILELAVANLAAAGLSRVTVVTGFASERIEELVPDLESRYGVGVDLVHNDRAEDWNNAYSLWLARDHFADGALLVNGDTVHPGSVEETLLAARGPGVLLAVDREKPLGDEEMKVLLDGDGRLERISKEVDPAAADGEYIGLALIEPEAAEDLADALEATWQRDPSLYYEDGFQELRDRGGEVRAAPIGEVDWVEVDNHDDLARAKEIECRY
jgi:choline kinase